MAFQPYHNITGSTGVTSTLIEPGSKSGNIKSILITNIHSTNGATVTLFLQSNPAAAEPETFNILSASSIPVAMSLLLDNEDMVSFNNSDYGLYITVGGSDTVDVLMSK
tara:strand:+ start:3959 stop:4285 length:327 start_codon:yes stop_codon:yes gene_type:complete